MSDELVQDVVYLPGKITGSTVLYDRFVDLRFVTLKTLEPKGEAKFVKKAEFNRLRKKGGADFRGNISPAYFEIVESGTGEIQYKVYPGPYTEEEQIPLELKTPRSGEKPDISIHIEAMPDAQTVFLCTVKIKNFQCKYNIEEFVGIECTAGYTSSAEVRRFYLPVFTSYTDKPAPDSITTFVCTLAGSYNTLLQKRNIKFILGKDYAKVDDKTFTKGNITVKDLIYIAASTAAGTEQQVIYKSLLKKNKVVTQDELFGSYLNKLVINDTNLDKDILNMIVSFPAEKDYESGFALMREVYHCVRDAYRKVTHDQDDIWMNVVGNEWIWYNPNLPSLTDKTKRLKAENNLDVRVLDHIASASFNGIMLNVVCAWIPSLNPGDIVNLEPNYLEGYNIPSVADGTLTAKTYRPISNLYQVLTYTVDFGTYGDNRMAIQALPLTGERIEDLRKIGEEKDTEIPSKEAQGFEAEESNDPEWLKLLRKTVDGKRDLVSQAKKQQYRLKKGDTLQSILKENFPDVSFTKTWNDLNGRDIPYPYTAGFPPPTYTAEDFVPVIIAATYEATQYKPNIGYYINVDEPLTCFRGQLICLPDISNPQSLEQYKDVFKALVMYAKETHNQPMTVQERAWSNIYVYLGGNKDELGQ